jgi:hypothetical protein
MPEYAYTPAAPLDLAQASELSLLVDLEARWENLRKVAPGYSLQDLQARQKAYDAFHAKLVAYNRRYTPPHVPELLLNTLGTSHDTAGALEALAQWCDALCGIPAIR